MQPEEVIWTSYNGPFRIIVLGRHKLVPRQPGKVIWQSYNGPVLKAAPWNELTCAEAARGGHWAVLQWARENGCPWDERTCSYAVAQGHWCVLEWCLNHEAPQDRNYDKELQFLATLRQELEDVFGRDVAGVVFRYL